MSIKNVADHTLEAHRQIPPAHLIGRDLSGANDTREHNFEDRKQRKSSLSSLQSGHSLQHLAQLPVTRKGLLGICWLLIFIRQY